MPFLTIKTNGFSNDNKLVEKAANVVADALGKPVGYVCAEIKYSSDLAFAGSKQKIGAWIEIASIGFKNRQQVVDVLTDFAVKNLDAEKELVCIKLTDLPASDVAHGGYLFG